MDDKCQQHNMTMTQHVNVTLCHIHLDVTDVGRCI